MRYVAYYRVSTAKQGASGLGLAAQETAVRSFIADEPIAAFTEVESGKRDDRPQLAAALAHARRHNATLVIAKLDRLARDVHFISGLMKSGVEIRACDIPTANRMVLHIMAAVAEGEREMISGRTKAALAAAKARGVRLGTPQTQRLAQERRAAADAHACATHAALTELRLEGVTGFKEIAARLNGRGVSTSTGKRWHPTTVQRLAERIEMLQRAGKIHRLPVNDGAASVLPTKSE
ncbi:recombinase family protein [Methylorubrum extorquens]|uniref:recombinase family protein n=1 Tax=Methylorubrum extorquens TaxID=408 RepID=UPI0009B6EE55|nr:recombinase family protein [Methylorubrum extorquens]